MAIIASFKSTPNKKLVISSDYLIANFLFGVPLRTIDGTLFTPSSIEIAIEQAQEEVERVLNLKLIPQIIREQRDFIIEDFRSWNQLPVTYPAVQCFELSGWLGSTQQINYPGEWISVRKTTNGKGYQRNIFLVPSGVGTGTLNTVAYSGISPQVGYFNNSIIPHYWSVTYLTGFPKIPTDIEKAIGLLASIPIYQALGNTIGKSGATSQSLRIDGLNQSFSVEPGGFTTKIKAIRAEYDALISSLKNTYKGILLMNC